MEQKEERPQLQVKKLHPDAILPTKGTIYSAGYDLYSIEDKVVSCKGKALVKTGIAIAIPPGNYGRIAPRSGLANKFMLDIGAGVIDEDYRGQIGIVLFNHGCDTFIVKKGDRIAQIIITKITYTDLVEVEELSETCRGVGGFGSTGVKKEQEHDTVDYNPLLNDKIFHQVRFKDYSMQNKMNGILKRMEAFPQELTDKDYQEFCVLGFHVMQENENIITKEQEQRYGKMAMEDLSTAKDMYVALLAYQDTENVPDLQCRLENIHEQEKHFIDS